MANYFNEVQTLTLTGSPTGGSFRLGFAGETGNAQIPWNADPARVQQSLDAIDALGAGNCVVGGSNLGGPYTVTFKKRWGYKDVPLLTLDQNDLIPAGASVTIAKTTPGGVDTIQRATTVVGALTPSSGTLPVTGDVSVTGNLSATTNTRGTTISTIGANGQSLTVLQLSELLTILDAATTDTTMQIPANAVVLGVSSRVTVVIPTAATFDVGIAGATTRYGTGIAVAAGTTYPGADDGARFYGSATKIRVTPNLTPADQTGRLRVTIFYYLITPPTS